MEYELLCEYSLETLNQKVNSRLSEGWEPLGMPSIATEEEHNWYAQAMIKRDPQINIRFVGGEERSCTTCAERKQCTRDYAIECLKPTLPAFKSWKPIKERS